MRATVVGFIGKDPIVGRNDSLFFSVGESRKGKDGEYETVWHAVSVYDPALKDLVNRYFKGGTRAVFYLRASPYYKEFSGEKYPQLLYGWTLEQFEFLPPSKSEGEGNGRQTETGDTPSTEPSMGSGKSYGNNDDDDIPF